MCIFCQDRSGDDPHETSSHNIGQRFENAVENSQDSTLKLRLGSLLMDPLNAIAYDMKYHVACLMKVERNNETTEEDKQGI